jgi:hypothetical protein
MRSETGQYDERFAFWPKSRVVKEVASLGLVVVMALLFVAFLTTLRPSAIAAVQGDKVIDLAPMKHTLTHSEDSSRAGTPPKMPGLTGQERSRR